MEKLNQLEILIKYEIEIFFKQIDPLKYQKISDVINDLEVDDIMKHIKLFVILCHDADVEFEAAKICPELGAVEALTSIIVVALFRDLAITLFVTSVIVSLVKA